VTPDAVFTKKQNYQQIAARLRDAAWQAWWMIACCDSAEHELQHSDETLTAQLNLEWPPGQSRVHGHGHGTGSSQTMMLLGQGGEELQLAGREMT
jgi:hypothetical protein